MIKTEYIGKNGLGVDLYRTYIDGTVVITVTANGNISTNPTKTNNDAYMYTCGNDMPTTLQTVKFAEEDINVVEVIRALRECAFIERKVAL